MECISRLESEIADLRKTLATKEKELYELKKKWISKPLADVPARTPNEIKTTLGGDLPRWAIERYSRQILVGGVGARGQARLCAARALVLGAGGLGCPAAAYLAGAGLGEIGLVDYDTVDLTNIHRQILHGEEDQFASKVDSAADSLRRINSNVKVTTYNVQLDSNNALDIITKYDVVLDCTDNVPTRYLLNDACALAKLPLISGSALKLEGQITIYGYRSTEDSDQQGGEYVGPCYRCVFPAPPPPAAVGSCSAHGVVGPVPAVVGALQALEAIKYIVGASRDKLLVGRMVIFDGEDATFRTVKLRPRNPECAACSATPTITKLLDYETFCKSKAKEKDLELSVLPPERRVSPAQLRARLQSRHLLVDVRSEHEFRMCHIDGAVNCPIDDMAARRGDLLRMIAEHDGHVTFVCRRGNDSQLAARDCIEALRGAGARVADLAGGLHAWAEHVDQDFPVY